MKNEKLFENLTLQTHTSKKQKYFPKLKAQSQSSKFRKSKLKVKLPRNTFQKQNLFRKFKLHRKGLKKSKFGQPETRMNRTFVKHDFQNVFKERVFGDKSVLSVF